MNGRSQSVAVEPRYTSRIIKASALIADTRVLLQAWDFAKSVEDNLSSARERNIFAKAARSRAEDILRIFRQRYFDDPEVGEMLAVVAGRPGWARVLERLLYFYSARNDRLLYDVVTEFLAPRQEIGHLDTPTAELRRQVQNWVDEGKTTSRWSAETIEHVNWSLLATLRDFGVLEGRTHKRISVPAVPIEAFVLLACALARDGANGEGLVRHPDWRLFFLQQLGVERLLLEAHQRHLLEYHAAGRVTRITLPAGSLAEVARALPG